MVIFSFFLFIERIIFMFSNKLEVKENVSQTFYYYFSGVGGLIYFFVLFCISIGLRTIWWTLKLRLLCHTPRMHFIRGLIAKATMLSPVIVP